MPPVPKRRSPRQARQPVIVGIAEAPLRDGKVEGGRHALAIQAHAARAAPAGSWGIPGPGNLMALTVGEYLGVRPAFIDGTQIGGSSFEAHVAHASLALQAGYCGGAPIPPGRPPR